jgi:hypothetical protein
MMPSSPMMGPMPNLPEQPSMYEVSRSLRLVLEAPRKLVRGLRRATEAAGGASEMVSGLQDPRVRRNAMMGIYHAAAQQEANGGPLAPVGPVVRAAVRFAEPLEDEQAAQQQSKRIQVRSNVRRAPVAPPPVAQAEAAAPTAEAPARPEPVRRTVAVRRVEPPVVEPPVAEAPAAEASAVEPAEPSRAAPVRRIAVGRPDRTPLEPELASGPRVVSYNGNGVHHPDDHA